MFGCVLVTTKGAVRGLPVGLSFIGAKWDDARMLALGGAYEAAAKAMITPTFAQSVETTPAVAPLLAPAR
jgi:amidase